MTSLKTSIKTITYLSDIGCLEIQGASLKAKIWLAESEMLRCSDGFEFVCDKSEKLRVTFALDFCDRGGIDWAAITGGYDSSTVRDVILKAHRRHVAGHTSAVADGQRFSVYHV